jgi:hypothetical protein
MCSTDASSLTPALFTRISIVPSARSASVNKRRAAAMSLMSHCHEKERRPRARTAASTSEAPSSSSLWQKATSAPSAAKARAIAAPIPRLPPVTSAVQFSSLPVAAIGFTAFVLEFDSRAEVRRHDIGLVSGLNVFARAVAERPVVAGQAIARASFSAASRWPRSSGFQTHIWPQIEGTSRQTASGMRLAS